MRVVRLHQKSCSQANRRKFVATRGVFGQRASLRVFTILISFSWPDAYTKCQRESRSSRWAEAQKRNGYPWVVTLHVALPAELQDAVRQARQRAEATGELLPTQEGPATAPMSPAVSKFIRQILTDGTYEQEIIRIGKEDPDLASM